TLDLSVVRYSGTRFQQLRVDHLVDAVTAEARARGRQHLETSARVPNDTQVECAAAEVHRERRALCLRPGAPQITQCRSDRLLEERQLPEARVFRGFRK